ncbi:hypothetical protein FISHEDRAFT_59121 [Fistulina hepatica ATCC 64428]|uniref:Uncharacterized protein n=1 Tax=Fistulina hepatica ATCC 64428 TaxID=1128425 RepID=A0A0D7ACF9_9AGAR|nr:hypothetical protein FISHEDRAFT_59121 [Fistulina hepatica ATCC 64428]
MSSLLASLGIADYYNRSHPLERLLWFVHAERKRDQRDIANLLKEGVMRRAQAFTDRATLQQSSTRDCSRYLLEAVSWRQSSKEFRQLILLHALFWCLRVTKLLSPRGYSGMNHWSRAPPTNISGNKDNACLLQSSCHINCQPHARKDDVLLWSEYDTLLGLRACITWLQMCTRFNGAAVGQTGPSAQVTLGPDFDGGLLSHAFEEHDTDPKRPREKWKREFSARTHEKQRVDVTEYGKLRKFAYQSMSSGI